MISTPRVSVLLPVYNAERYLLDAINSILNQTMQDFELIAFDDGSTDSSFNMLLEIARDDPRLRVFSRCTRGLAATLNEMIGLARAPYFARMDCDDISLPERFECQVARLDAESDLVAVGGNALLIDPDGRPIMIMGVPSDHDTIDDRHLEMPPNCSIWHPSIMMRRTAVEQVGGYHEDYPYAEDVYLYLRLAEMGRLANLEEVVLHYRLHPQSMGHTSRFKQIESSIRAMQDARLRRGLPQHDDVIDPVQLAAKDDSESLLVRWGWWALLGENTATARYYAGKALLEAPLDRMRWMLGACAVRDSVRHWWHPKQG
jgi:glycosyltransferase involved in cell wall biosynthesis